jgi:hypothetical protein
MGTKITKNMGTKITKIWELKLPKFGNKIKKWEQKFQKSESKKLQKSGK